jgi:glycosyltransferase involved in cell wall biosynthesis
MRLRIALTADPDIPDPPKQYGGIERKVDMVGQGLVARGHEVTLFAHERSNSAGTLIPWMGTSSSSLGDTVRNAIQLFKESRRRQFHVIHSFSRLAYLTPVMPSSIAKLMSYQRPISRRTTRLAHALSRGTLEFTAASKWMIHGVRDIGVWRIVPNGVPPNLYTSSVAVDERAPFVFLGRVEEIKGPHLAIEIAKQAGRKLIIAGNIPADKRAWFRTNIEPHIDGAQVSYMGPVTDSEKNDLLRGAAALLMPILWDEPFGIVMVEAMACGTPVVGFDKGAVPEVIENGITGFICKDVGEAIAAVGKIDQIDRLACRGRVERLYTSDVIVNAYIEIYQSMLDSEPAAA